MSAPGTPVSSRPPTRPPPRWGGGVWVLLVVVVGVAAPAHAHDRSVSHARVVLSDDGASIDLRVRALDRNALRAEGRDPAAHLPAAVTLDGCAPVAQSFTTLDAPIGWARYAWRVRCDGAPSALRAAPIPSRSTHVCHARVVRDGATSEYVLSELSPVAALDTPADGPAFARWVPVGVEHIVLGLDHLLFLAMLLVLAGSLRETATMVTGFTLGHSVTLAAAALGAVRVEPGPIEAVIGLSVALVAAENVWSSSERRDRVVPLFACGAPLLVAALTRQPAYAGVALFAACHFGLVARAERPTAWRWAVASVFGLLHGFGFAGALAEGGLPATDTVGALLGFNVGVELGQLALVALAWPALLYLKRDEGRGRLTVQLASALGVAFGAYWFVQRAFA